MSVRWDKEEEPEEVYSTTDKIVILSMIAFVLGSLLCIRIGWWIFVWRFIIGEY